MTKPHHDTINCRTCRGTGLVRRYVDYPIPRVDESRREACAGTGRVERTTPRDSFESAKLTAGEFNEP